MSITLKIAVEDQRLSTGLSDLNGRHPSVTVREVRAIAPDRNPLGAIDIVRYTMTGIGIPEHRQNAWSRCVPVRAIGARFRVGGAIARSISAHVGDGTEEHSHGIPRPRSVRKHRLDCRNVKSVCIGCSR